MSETIIMLVDIIKPGVRPQPAFDWLWARAWFTEIVFVKTCVCVCVCVCVYLPIYLCLFVHTHPREQKH